MTSQRETIDKEALSEELQRLIAEQRRDDTGFVRHEAHVAFSLDGRIGEVGTFQDLVNHRDGTVRMPSRTRTYSGCPVHGRSAMVEDKDGGYRCKVCRADRAREWRRRNGARPAKEHPNLRPDGKFKGGGPRCGHDPSRFAEDRSARLADGSYRLRCNECQRVRRLKKLGRWPEDGKSSRK